MVLTVTACAESPSGFETAGSVHDEALVEAVSGSYPGYPLIVSLDSVDSRIAEDFRALGATRAVAIVPGAYVPYGENQDPDHYLLVADGALGNCSTLEWLEGMKQTIYEGIDESRATLSYTCLDNMSAGSEEPYPYNKPW